MVKDHLDSKVASHEVGRTPQVDSLMCSSFLPVTTTATQLPGQCISFTVCVKLNLQMVPFISVSI